MKQVSAIYSYEHQQKWFCFNNSDLFSCLIHVLTKVSCIGHNDRKSDGYGSSLMTILVYCVHNLKGWLYFCSKNIDFNQFLFHLSFTYCSKSVDSVLKHDIK